MKDKNDELTPLEIEVRIEVRNVVHTMKCPDICLAISGISVTITRPDGTEDEAIFGKDFTSEEIATAVFNNTDGYSPTPEAKKKLAETVEYVRLGLKKLDLSFPSPLRLKIQRVPRKTVTYHVKDPVVD